jgi:hypothetical protein
MSFYYGIRLWPLIPRGGCMVYGIGPNGRIRLAQGPEQEQFDRPQVPALGFGGEFLGDGPEVRRGDGLHKRLAEGRGLPGEGARVARRRGISGDKPPEGLAVLGGALGPSCFYRYYAIVSA